MAENKTKNAQFIYNFFIAEGWTAQSICAMLGNIQVESGIIADVNETSGGGGYGLVQWTPKSELVNWANQKNLDYKKIETQCKRIKWELANGQQFYKTKAYPLNFKEFTKSKLDPEYLAQVFLNNYERPTNTSQPIRSQYAKNWYSFFSTTSQTKSNESRNTTPSTQKGSSSYTVKSGDTLGGIASKFGVTVANLQAWNKITNVNSIKVGQVLKINPSTSAAKTTSTSKTSTYTVKAGDTLGEIASKFGVTVANLQAWNKITNVNSIKVGQVLRIK